MLQTDSWYRCIIHIKSSNHTLWTSRSYLLPPTATANCTNTSYRLSLYTLRTDVTENTACIVGKACLPSHFLATEVYCCDADHIENTSTVLLTTRVCWTVYWAVDWQLSNQIRYNIYTYMIEITALRSRFCFNYVVVYSDILIPSWFESWRFCTWLIGTGLMWLSQCCSEGFTSLKRTPLEQHWIKHRYKNGTTAPVA
jgi:hypothetical protein